MSTKKPRITVTLEPHAHEILTRLSAAGGDSMSQIVSEFIEVAIGPMERMVVLLERANAAPEEARADVAASLAKAERELVPSILKMLGQSDLFIGEMETALDAGQDARVAAPGAAEPRTVPTAGPRKRQSTPVAVTRGLGPPQQARKGKKGTQNA